MEKRKGRSWISTAITVLAIVAIDQLISLPYFVIAPGDAQPTNALVEVAPDKRFAPQGDFFLTTVSLYEAHPSDALWSVVAPGHKLEKKEDTVGELSTEEYLELNRDLVESSKLAAVSVAMTRAGYPVGFTGDGAQVSDVNAGAPAEGRLREGDVVRSVGGQKITTAQQLTDLVRSTPVNTALTIDVTGVDGTARTEIVTTGSRDDGGSFLGVLIATENPRVDAPFAVTIKDTPFGGPSAGLAFTLSLLDNLTAGELTGGKPVAVTGTIELDGKVGEVGGVEQKTHTVNDSRAKLFLVPTGEVEDAKRIADDDVTVVAVDTLDEALEALKNNGGDLSGIPQQAPSAT